MDMFSIDLKKLWNVWEIRAMIITSLCLQIILILFGSKRKTNGGIPIRVLVWSAYLAANWVATVCLSALATNGDYSAKATNSVQSFWAPFLLLHLGGPDSITACSLEDNDLWLRHFLRLIVQVGVAIYILLRSWSTGNSLGYIAIPVFFIGIIKYGERTWVLRSSSTKRLKKDLLTDPDPGPDVALILDQNVQDQLEQRPAVIVHEEDIKSENDYIVEGNFLHKRLLYLFAGLILGFYERRDSYSIIHNKSPADAFKIVAVELGFMYDRLYTKTSWVYTYLGVIIRCVNLCFLLSTLLAFVIAVDKHVYETIDLAITYSLFVCSIVLEVFAFGLLFISDWTTKLKKDRCDHFRCMKSKRWSGSIGQYNLFDVCLTKPISCMPVQKLLGVREALENFNCKYTVEISDGLQSLIFNHLRDKVKAIKDDEDYVSLCKELLACRGNYVLQNFDSVDDFRWCTLDVEFDHSLLLWHIATTICYYNDKGKEARSRNSRYRISKCLSDYMLYLLVMRETMLPEGIGEIRYRDTCAEARRFFKYKNIDSSYRIGEACTKLLDVNVSSLEMLNRIKTDRSQSVLFSGCILAKVLDNIELASDDQNKGYRRKWKLISEVWVEMLVYAASQCGWKEHGQQLRRGGELITHVAVLMANFGLSEQYQIQSQYINWTDVSYSKPEKHVSYFEKHFCGSLTSALCCLFWCCPCLCCLLGDDRCDKFVVDYLM